MLIDFKDEDFESKIKNNILIVDLLNLTSRKVNFKKRRNCLCKKL